MNFKLTVFNENWKKVFNNLKDNISIDIDDIQKSNSGTFPIPQENI